MSEEKIGEIKLKFQKADIHELPSLMTLYDTDCRFGVKQLLVQADHRIKAYEAEEKRVFKMLQYEREYADYGVICGIDEAGRGPLAGPVVAAAVILSTDDPIFYVNDSKKLSEKKREALYDEIMARAISVGVGIASPALIDEINILQADYVAMQEAVFQLKPTPQVLLNDAVTIPNLDMKQVPIIKGDAKSLSIAAASIVAKVTRDRMMRDYDALFPEYHFLQNKGYGTAQHIEALKKYGPTPIHRRSFIGNFLTDDGIRA